jgi:hypothetical protein
MYYLTTAKTIKHSLYQLYLERATCRGEVMGTLDISAIGRCIRIQSESPKQETNTSIIIIIDVEPKTPPQDTVRDRQTVQHGVYHRL